MISTSCKKKGAKRRCEFTFRKWTEGKRAWLVVACIALMTPYSDHQFRAFHSVDQREDSHEWIGEYVEEIRPRSELDVGPADYRSLRGRALMRR